MIPEVVIDSDYDTFALVSDEHGEALKLWNDEDNRHERVRVISCGSEFWKGHREFVRCPYLKDRFTYRPVESK